uniref:Uncharacterized protein n=1 Tax=Plectus sambesii TaxID=2011161 RepID=A0A914VTK5_9BILA
MPVDDLKSSMLSFQFQRTEIREQYFDFSYPILQIKPAFVVKRRAAEFTETAMAVFHVFSSKVWLTILAVLITQVVCLYCTDYVQLGHGQDADMGVWSPLDMSFYLFRMFIMQCNGALRHPTTTGWCFFFCPFSAPKFCSKKHISISIYFCFA